MSLLKFGFQLPSCNIGPIYVFIRIQLFPHNNCTYLHANTHGYNITAGKMESEVQKRLINFTAGTLQQGYKYYTVGTLQHGYFLKI